MTIALQKTNDLSIFQMHDTNRLVSGAAGFLPRKDLLASMKKHGFRSTQPISCKTLPNGKLEIFDGHNRFVTAKFLGLPVYFLAYPNDLGLSPVEFSKGQKTWSFGDKAKAFAQESPDFAEVVQFHEETGINLSSAFAMFNGEVASSSNMAKSINNGAFKIRDREAPMKVALIVKTLNEYCDFSTNKNFVSAISKATFAHGFSVVHMVDRIKRNPELVKQQRSLDDYLAMLELIYNRNTKGERLYLCAEVDKAMKSRTVAIKKPQY